MLTANEKEATLKGVSEAIKQTADKPVHMPQNDPNHVRNACQDFINDLIRNRRN
jgi:hypothetical protein